MSDKKIKLLVVFGTRPEAIKMAPIIKELEKNEFLKPIICVTAQHREMLDQVLDLFGIKPDYDLNLMTDNQTLADLTSKIISKITEIIILESPDLVLVQGDTTTTFVSSLAAFYQRIRIAHIEAGLRTNNKYSPFPEEINRRLTSHIADIHFAPTEEARNNLVKEGIFKKSIFVTGNTVIDALKWVVSKQKKESEKWQDFFILNYNITFSNCTKTVLVTGHRRESFGQGFKNICSALSILAEDKPTIQIVYPVHLNPNVQKPVYSILGNIKNIHLISPLDYEPFVFLMNKSHLILTDSGGIQEEAPSLGKPVLVMRDITERPEGIEAGTAKMVGTDSKTIVSETEKLLYDKVEYEKMAKSINPYGDGNAAKIIVNIIRQELSSS
jgi:UDP-N-acetylglucosamine 2-epimerase (non-hydrolysing)